MNKKDFAVGLLIGICVIGGMCAVMMTIFLLL